MEVPSDVPIRLTFIGDTLVVAGVIDVDGAPWFDRALLRCDDVSPVEVDLGAVEFIDSAGLRCLLLAGRRARSRGTVLRVTQVSEPVTRLLELTGTDVMFAD